MQRLMLVPSTPPLSAAPLYCCYFLANNQIIGSINQLLIHQSSLLIANAYVKHLAQPSDQPTLFVQDFELQWVSPLRLDRPEESWPHERHVCSGAPEPAYADHPPTSYHPGLNRRRGATGQCEGARGADADGATHLQVRGQR